MLRLGGFRTRLLRQKASNAVTSQLCRGLSSSVAPQSPDDLAFETMASSFRRWGHLEAHLDPLELRLPEPVGELHVSRFRSLFHRHLSRRQSHSTVFLPRDVEVANGQQVYDHLRKTYCGKIGYEFQHVSTREELLWLAQAAETIDEKFPVSTGDLRNAQTLMLMADLFENFMARKFSTFKRYSGEGAETMLAGANVILQEASAVGVSDVIIGMPHRGRLALLVALLEYPAHKLFHKVRGLSEFPEGIRGVDDVTSHIATSMNKRYADKQVHVSLLHNPSHLEIINPVVMGKARAKNDDGGDAMGFMLHGDSAFSGQGCVPEALYLSQLSNFESNGSLHMIVNNQVGYTTTYEENRSSRYCSDVAKAIDAPVLHVNGESTAHVIQACRLAMAYRQQFKKDIFIDLITYRLHGHNEVDEPRFTQPRMYEAVGKAGRFPWKFSAELVARGLVKEAWVKKLVERSEAHLEAELKKSQEYVPAEVDAFKGKWLGMEQPTVQDLYLQPTTGVAVDTLKEIGLASVEVPAHVKVHNRLQRTHIQNRKKMLSKDNVDAVRVDWATAEAIAFGTLLREGNSVRLCGQDCRRGTFSQRHASFTDQKTEELYFPLRHLKDSKGSINVINSNLSELGVMAFEYGYSWENPNNLVIWEAQFGDFFNTAQTVVDQFLSCGESKWMRQSGLVLLLPHGYDGMGPDHSSGRVERFLQLCDSPALAPFEAGKDWREYLHDSNLIVVNPTTPANYFHVLRRQQHRNFRKPLVVMGPKTILRLPEATSALTEMGPDTSFKPVYGDDSIQDKSKVKKVLFCSGKLFYELREKRREASADVAEQVALIRIEELAPFPFEQVHDQLQQYLKSTKEFAWIQEEPMNLGPWTYIQRHFEKLLGDDNTSLQYIGREATAACAVGLKKRHEQELKEIFDKAFKL